MGIMDVAGTMQHIEHLAGLGDRAEERIIAALPLLLAVEPYGRALGRFPCADHRAIEVERHAREPKGHQPCHNPLPHESQQALCAFRVRPRQSPRQRGDIRQTAQAERPQDQGVIRIVAHIAQSPVSQHEVQHQTQHQRCVSEDRAEGEMAEAAAQLLLEPQTSEQRLKEDEARERGQLAVFKTQCRQAMGLAVDFGFAILHGKRSPSGMGLFAKHIIPRSEDRSLDFLIMRSAFLFRRWLSPVVMSSATLQIRCNPVFYAIS